MDILFPSFGRCGGQQKEEGEEEEKEEEEEEDVDWPTSKPKRCCRSAVSPETPPNPQGSRSLIDLPEELVEHILSFLTPVPHLLRVERTCHTLRNAARQPPLWNRVTLAAFPRITSAQVQQFAMIYLHATRELSISGCRRVSAAAMQSVGSVCGALLRRVDLSSGVGSRAATALLKQCSPDLVWINLSINLSTKDDIVRLLVTRCPKIVHLDLSLTSVSWTAIQLLSIHCHSLCNMYLNHCPRFEVSEGSTAILRNGFPVLETLGVRGFRDRLRLLALLCGCPRLRSLHLDKGDATFSPEAWTMVPAFPSLEILGLARAEVTRSGLSHFLIRSPSLQELDLSWCHIPMESIAMDLVMHCPHLRILNATGTSVTEDGVDTVRQGCEEIEEVIVASCRAIPLLHRRVGRSLSESH